VLHLPINALNVSGTGLGVPLLNSYINYNNFYSQVIA
jgi:hypothetical protein